MILVSVLNMMVMFAATIVAVAGCVRKPDFMALSFVVICLFLMVRRITILQKHSGNDSIVVEWLDSQVVPFAVGAILLAMVSVRLWRLVEPGTTDPTPTVRP